MTVYLVFALEWLKNSTKRNCWLVLISKAKVSNHGENLMDNSLHSKNSHYRLNQGRFTVTVLLSHHELSIESSLNKAGCGFQIWLCFFRLQKQKSYPFWLYLYSHLDATLTYKYWPVFKLDLIFAIFSLLTNVAAYCLTCPSSINRYLLSEYLHSFLKKTCPMKNITSVSNTKALIDGKHQTDNHLQLHSWHKHFSWSMCKLLLMWWTQPFSQTVLCDGWRTNRF